jgi:hypothetical protein
VVCSDDNERGHQCVWRTYVLYIVPNVGTLVVAFPGEESDTANEKRNALAAEIYGTCLGCR